MVQKGLEGDRKSTQNIQNPALRGVNEVKGGGARGKGGSFRLRKASTTFPRLKCGQER